MKRGMKSILLPALLATLISWPAAGRVFRLGVDTRGRLNVAGLPWQKAYQTRMTVNGRKNDVEVYSARYSEPVVEQLVAQFNRQGATVKIGKGPDGGALGVARWDGGEARIIVLAPEDQPNNLVFLFYPEAGNSGTPESPIPDYPRGTVTSSVVNDDTKALCTTLKTLDSGMQVQRHYAEALARDGWRSVLPLRMSGGMTFYRKGERTCCILAKERNNGETLVTVLVRNKGF